PWSWTALRTPPTGAVSACAHSCTCAISEDANPLMCRRPVRGIERSLVTTPADPLTEADRADNRIDTGADRSPWPLLRNGDVPLVRAKSLDGLVNRHLMRSTT